MDHWIGIVPDGESDNRCAGFVALKSPLTIQEGTQGWKSVASRFDVDLTRVGQERPKETELD